VQGSRISPLFHEGAQDIQLINLIILPRWVAGFEGAEAKLVSMRLVLEAVVVWMVAGQIRVCEMRHKRHMRRKSSSHVLDRRSLADRDGSAPSVR
jgi:hypothetical protein